MNIFNFLNDDRRVYLSCKPLEVYFLKSLSTPKYTSWGSAWIRAAILLALLVATASACAPGAASTAPGALAQQEVAARHTQEWVETYQTGTAAAANQEVATEVAEVRQTEMAVAMRQTETADQLRATQMASTQVAVLGQATVTAQAWGMSAVATQSAFSATATAQSARAATVATQEAAEQRRVEMTNGARALIPWLLLLAFAALFIVIIYQVSKALVRQASVIRNASGDVHTILLDASFQEVRAVNPEKNLDPVLRLGRTVVQSVGHPDPRVQFALTQNEQMLQLARTYVRQNRRITDPRKIEELKEAFAAGHQAPPQLSMVHPYYGIDPFSLPEIPLFDVGSRLLSGGSRSGKTNLAQYDLFRMNVQVLAVYDPKHRPGKWPEHAEVMTEPEQLLRHLLERQKLFEYRRDTQGSGYTPAVTVIDEYTALVELSKLSSEGPALKEAIARAWALVMYGAEFNVNVWILSQTSNAASLGLSGRGDFRDSLTRITFEWRPTSRAEMNIPRIAEVSTGDTSEKYLVPRWSSPVPQLSPARPRDSLGLSQTVWDSWIAYLKKNVPCAAEFSDQELRTIVEMFNAGESGNAIREKLGRNRSWIYELVAACRQYQERKV